MSEPATKRAEPSAEPAQSPPSRWRYARAAWALGLVCGLAVALLDIVIALCRHPGDLPFVAALAGAVEVALVDITLALAVAAWVVVTAACMFTFDALGAHARALRTLAAAVVRTAERPREQRRVAVLVVATGACLIGGYGVLQIVAPAVSRVRADWLAAIPVGLWCTAWLALVLALARLAARALERGLGRLPDAVAPVLTVRSTVIAGVLGALVGALAMRTPLIAFVRAVDIWPLTLLGLLPVACALALLAIAAGGRALTVADRVTRRRVSLATIIALAMAWLVLPTNVGQRGAALRFQRKSAPLCSTAIPWLVRALDFDRDGYSSFFGDGDCAAWDRTRNPGAREIVGNGVDEDCFDGDLTAQVVMRPPAPAPVPESIPRDLSFVVILVDALRYDHLGLAGYARATSPNIDDWARDAAVFERAYSPSSYTYPSTGSLITSRFPSQLPRKLVKKQGGLPADTGTMARLFSDAGYTTSMVTDYGASTVKANLDLGYARKKRFYDQAEQVTGYALSELQAIGSSRFFLWVDYIAPHNPYRGHQGIPRFGDDFMDVYDHEIAHIDHQVGPLLRRLSEPDLRDRVVVVLIADHGEAFGEHGTYYHGHNLHEENVRVPFVMRVPGVPPRRLGNEPVSLLDLLPTMLNLARLPVPADLVGHDQTGALVTGVQAPDRSVFLESWFSGYGVTSSSYHAAVVTRQYKLIEETDIRSIRLYDLERDPGETRDRADDLRDVLWDMIRLQKRYQSVGR